MKKYYFIIVFCFSIFSFAQKISLESLWLKGEYWGKYVQTFSWMLDNEYYTELKSQQFIIKYKIEDKEIIDTILKVSDIKINNYHFSKDEQKILLFTEKENLYRHSYSSICYLYDRKKQKLTKIDTSNILNPTFSLDGNQIAYTKNNNLYIYDIAKKESLAITQNGKWNELLNGRADWVTEEEFSFTKAFWWNSTSKQLAYLTFNEKEVPVYDMQTWKNDLYPKNYSFKYPKAGEKNASVQLCLYDLETEKTSILLDETEHYLLKIQWINTNEFVVERLNRLQNKLEVLKINVLTQEKTLIYEESSNEYVEVVEQQSYFSEDYFLISSEKSGFRHLYLYDYQGKKIKQLTKGDWEIDHLNYVNEKTTKIYYTSTEKSFSERHLYEIDFDGKNKIQLTKEEGVHRIKMSSNGLYFIDYYSSSQKPLQVILQKIGESKEIFLEQNQELQTKLKEQDIIYPESFSFTNSEGIKLNGWMMKPKKIKRKQKCPVLMFVYGGPGYQTVLNKWGGINFLWYQLLVEKGYVIVSVDGRGTGGRGAKFKKSTYGQLGNLEYTDQIETANYLKKLSFIDENRLGIWGWSFGGYVSSLCMTKGNGIFKMGIAVAPVTNWRFYDSMYSERYLGIPQENAKGYDENSPVHFADKLQGDYLLIHGTGDDNVHYQHAITMQNSLIKANKKFDMFSFPDRNHGIYGGNTRYYLYQLMTNYIFQKL